VARIPFRELRTATELLHIGADDLREFAQLAGTEVTEIRHFLRTSSTVVCAAVVVPERDQQRRNHRRDFIGHLLATGDAPV